MFFVVLSINFHSEIINSVAIWEFPTTGVFRWGKKVVFVGKHHSPLQGSFLTRNSSRAIQPPPTLTITVLRKILTKRSCWESPNWADREEGGDKEDTIVSVLINDSKGTSIYPFTKSEIYSMQWQKEHALTEMRSIGLTVGPPPSWWENHHRFSDQAEEILWISLQAAWFAWLLQHTV